MFNSGFMSFATLMLFGETGTSLSASLLQILQRDPLLADLLRQLLQFLKIIGVVSCGRMKHKLWRLDSSVDCVFVIATKESFTHFDESPTDKSNSPILMNPPRHFLKLLFGVLLAAVRAPQLCTQLPAILLHPPQHLAACCACWGWQESRLCESHVNNTDGLLAKIGKEMQWHRVSQGHNDHEKP